MKVITVLLSVVASTQVWADEMPIELKSSTKSQYFLIEKSGTNERPELVLKRVRAGATSYSRRLFDCATRKTGTVGTAESLETLGETDRNAEMYTPSAGSVAYALWEYACGNGQ